MLPERPLGDLVELARRVEALGYDYLWVADEKFYRDPWVTLAAAGLATSRIRLGTGVTEPYARHPALIAMAMATLEELCPGRAVVGLGAGGPGFPPMGVTRTRPARALPEAVAIIRGLLSGARVDYRGEVLSFAGGSLNFKPLRELPVYVAARGSRVLRSAGAVADGVIAAPFASAQAVAYAAGEVGRGAASVRRPAPRLAARVDVCIGRTREEARDAVRYFVALPLWVSFPDWSYAEACGVRIESEELRDLLARRDYRDIAAAGRLLPEALIDHFAVAGTEAEVAERLGQLAPLIDQLIVHPVPAPEWDHERCLTAVARTWDALFKRGDG
jgi:5,10-methylenetetrahydromethanopterin reductase